ncbi:hypothetical protein MASR1M46_03890 [Bacteroidales bacterium]
MAIRQALANDYYAASSTLQLNRKSIKATGGLSYSYYDGSHFGNLIWSKWRENIPDNYRWYLNDGYKGDLSFCKGGAEYF